MCIEWFVYVLASSKLTRTYVGCTVDINRRLRQHNGELKGGARRTRAGRPWRVVKIYGPFGGRGEAQRIERAVKKLRGNNRLNFKDCSIR